MSTAEQELERAIRSALQYFNDTVYVASPPQGDRERAGRLLAQDCEDAARAFFEAPREGDIR